MEGQMFKFNKDILRILIILIPFIIMISGCANVGDYLKFWSSQRELKSAFQQEPSASLLNALNPEGVFALQGRVHFNKEYKGSILVLAVTDRFKKREIVITKIMHSPVEFYQIYLAEGQYDLYFLADLNGNGFYEADEVVGKTDGMPIRIDKSVVKDGLTINGPLYALDLEKPVKVDLPIKIPARSDNYVYKSLNDPFFDPQYGRMGLYDPKSFLSHTQRFFFSLEKFDPGKTIVIFVHGVDGTPRHFQYLVSGLDRSRYQPWFYYYPSGVPLQKLGSNFAALLRSGNESKEFPLKDVIIVAHSMGGLVALSGMDQLCVEGVPSYLKGFVSFNTPYGGIEAMVAGEKNAPVVVPSWRDVTPGSPFLKRLYKARTNQGFPMYLYFGYKTGDSSDGTITLQSQLAPSVHFTADKSFGFNATHEGILNDDAARQHFYHLLASFK
jgi:pimeloyl-ACP methyl ester carboxylesterase